VRTVVHNQGRAGVGGEHGGLGGGVDGHRQVCVGET
jgi:hypothetical protein